MKIHLEDVKINCVSCDASATGKEINDRIFMFYDENANLVSLPQENIDLDQAHELGSMKLYCECCQDDREEEF